MTKEMRPSHRIDVLTDSLVYYAQKSISNIGWSRNSKNTILQYVYIYYVDTILVKRLQRAQKVEGESFTKLQELMTSSADIVVCIENAKCYV